MKLVFALVLVAAVAVASAAASSESGPSRNGLIAFQRVEANGTSAIFTVDPRSGRVARLTGPFSPTPGTPRWSPDGSIGYQGEWSGERSRVALVDPRTGRTSSLPPGVRFGDGFDWSPDGRRLVLQRGSGLVIVSRRGKLLRRLTKSSDDDSPAWSPDGRSIAYADGDLRVRVLALGSGRSRRLSEAEANSPAWSPDGKQLVVSDYPDLYLLDVRDGSRRQLTHHDATCGGGAWGPAWTRSSWIAFTDCADDRLRLVDPGTGVVTDLGVSGLSPSWSPDGSQLVANSPQDDDDSPRSSDGLQIVDVATHTVRPLTFVPRPGSDADPAWTADGRSLAVSSFPSVRTVSSDGSDLGVVPGAYWEPSWAPDGHRLIAQTDDCCTFSIIDVRTGSMYDALVDEGLGDPTPCSPAWSPGGRWIAFAQTYALGTGLYDVRTDRERTLAFRGSHPDWRPGGRMLALDTTEPCSGSPHRKPGVSVFVAPIGGKRRQFIARNASNPTWSPGGSKIAFVRLVGSRKDPEIFVMNADGSQQRRLTHHRGWDLAPDWQPLR